MTDPFQYLPGSRKLWLGLLALGVVTALGARQVYVHYRYTSYLDRLLGCTPVAGIAESGFHYQEGTDAEPFRWTNGAARMLVPINSRHPPRELWVSIETFRPHMKPVPFQIVVDGTALFDGTVPPGKWETTVDLGAHEFGERAFIELRSDTFVPQGVMEDGTNTDSRRLGVQVKGLMLLSGQEEA